MITDEYPDQKPAAGLAVPAEPTVKRTASGMSTNPLRTLRAENEELRRRLEECEGQLVVAATVGQNLLLEHDKLRARLHETETGTSGNDSEPARRTSLDLMRDIENDFDAISSSLKGFVGKLSSRSSSPESLPSGQKRRAAQDPPPAPTSPRKLSRRGFKKPQSPRKMAASRTNKFVDSDLASDIDNHLIHQVRMLRGDLGILNEEKREMHDKIARLESQLEGVRKQRQKDAYAASKKDEKIWDLELQNQQIREQASKAEAEGARMRQNLRQMDVAYGQSVEMMEAMKNANSQQSKSFDQLRARLEIELSRSRGLIIALESEKAALSQNCQDLIMEARAQTFTAPDLPSPGSLKSVQETEFPIRPSSPAPSSSPASPDRSPSKHTFFVESLSSSLSHAHQQINELEESVRESEYERGELVKLLAEAQETIEAFQQKGPATPPQAVVEEVKEKIQTVTRNRRHIDDDETVDGDIEDALIVREFETPRRMARNLLNEFKEALTEERKSAKSWTKRDLSPAEASPTPVKERQHDTNRLKAVPLYDFDQDITGKGEGIAQAVEPDVSPMVVARLSLEGVAVETVTTPTDAKDAESVSRLPIRARSRLSRSPTKTPGKFSLAVTKAQDKLMVQLEEIVDREVDLVLCVDSSMQTLSDGNSEEAFGFYASGQPSVLTIQQRPKRRRDKVLSEASNFVESGTTMDDFVSDIDTTSWISRAVSHPTLSVDTKNLSDNDEHERAMSMPSNLRRPSSPTSPSSPLQQQYLTTSQRKALNSWGTMYAPQASPAPWPLPPSKNLRPASGVGPSSTSATISSTPRSNSNENLLRSISATPAPMPLPALADPLTDTSVDIDEEIDGEQDDKTLQTSVMSVMSVVPPSLPGEPGSPATADPEGTGEMSSSLNLEDIDMQDSDWDEDENNSIVSSTAEWRLQNRGEGSTSTSSSMRRMRPRNMLPKQKPVRRKTTDAPANPSSPFTNIMQNAKSLASLRSLGGSSAVFSEGSFKSQEKSDKDIQSLTHTMVGSWFQKFNRHNRNPQLRYFWVNPYSRALNWAPKPPSQGKKNMQTKTVFIVSLRWKEPDRQYRNYPPGPEHAIIIETPHREVRIVSTNWNDHEQWVTGLSLLLERTHRSRPLHEQFGIMDRDSGNNVEDDVEDEDEEEAAAMPSPTASESPEKSQPRPVFASAQWRESEDSIKPVEDQAMTLDELGRVSQNSGLHQDKPDNISHSSTGSDARKTPILRRNSFWNSMQELARPKSSLLPRPIATASTASLQSTTTTPSTITTTPRPDRPSGLPVAPHTVSHDDRRAGIKREPLQRRPSIGDMLLGRRFSRDLSSLTKRRSWIIGMPSADGQSMDKEEQPPLPSPTLLQTHRQQQQQQKQHSPQSPQPQTLHLTEGQQHIEGSTVGLSLSEPRRPRPPTKRKSVGGVMLNTLRNVSGNLSILSGTSGTIIDSVPVPAGIAGGEHPQRAKIPQSASTSSLVGSAASSPSSVASQRSRSKSDAQLHRQASSPFL
ncbi:hypothetical protein DFJ77DRAFT_325822 [Powellomyces hirtus]|nr:hypothetical protein DFJ77DRAFT_325822 [Powellomyces hirtus]